MKTRLKFICLVSFAVCLLCGQEKGQQLAHSGDTKTTRGQVKKQKPGPGAKQQLLTISKETTYYTEPLDEHGFVDFLAAINADLSKGVTPENNAAVCYVRAITFSETNPKVREKFCKQLGIAVPEKIDCEREFEIYLKKKYQAETGEDQYKAHKWAEKQMLKIAQPWKAVDHPEAIAFLEQSKPRLELLRAAREKTTYWYPLVSYSDQHEPFQIVNIYIDEVQNIRSHGRILNLRIMLNLGEENFQAVKEDLLTLRCMGHNVARGATIIEILLGLAISSSASIAENEFANRCPDAKILEEYLAGLQQLPKTRSMRESIDKVERIVGIEAVSSLAKVDFGVINKEEFLAAISSEGSINSLLFKLDYDWDVIAKELNHTFDRSLTNMSLPRNVRFIMQEELNNELDEIRKNFINADQVFMNLISKKARSESIGKVFCGLLMPAIVSAINNEDRNLMRGKLTELACILNLYKLKNGQYPQSLELLTPHYLKEIPQDIFAEAPLKYESDGKTYTLYSVGINTKDDGGLGYEDSDKTDDLVIKKR